MSKEKIYPLEGEVQVKIEKAEVGVLDTSSRRSGVECGEVIAVGKDVTELKKGQKIFFKSWALDPVTHDGKDYYFISLMTKGIKAIIE